MDQVSAPPKVDLISLCAVAVLFWLWGSLGIVLLLEPVEASVTIAVWVMPDLAYSVSVCNRLVVLSVCSRLSATRVFLIMVLASISGLCLFTLVVARLGVPCGPVVFCLVLNISLVRTMFSETLDKIQENTRIIFAFYSSKKIGSQLKVLKHLTRFKKILQ